MRDTEGMVKDVRDAKVAVFGIGIEAAATETKGNVVINSAEELLSYNKGEEARMEETIKGISDAGVKVIVACGAISEMAMHFIERYGLMCIRIMSKFELRRISRTVGATAMVRVGPPTPEEMGHCDKVSVREFGDRKAIIFEQSDDASRIATIVLRSSTRNLLDDIERSISDGVNTAKALCKDPRLLAGAGAAEIELARHIRKCGEETPGLEQYSIKSFASSLEVVARTLAANAGHNSTDVISRLYAEHEDGNTNFGVDIHGHASNPVKDTAAAGIYDALAVKRGALQLAGEAAVTVMRVDQIIMSKQAGGPKKPQ